MPFPSWRTTTPGQGGGASGSARKYGRALPVTGRARSAATISGDEKDAAEGLAALDVGVGGGRL